MNDSRPSNADPRPDDEATDRASDPAGPNGTALQERDATYRAVFENIDEAFALCELVRDDVGRPVDYRILDVNRALEVSTGVRRTSALGRLRSQIVDIADPEALERFAQVVETGRPLHYERYSVAIDRWVENLVSPQGGDRFSMLFKDITKRRRAEAALREREERHAFLLGLSDALRPLRDPIALQRTACGRLGKYLGADRVHYAEQHPDEGYVLVSTDYCGDGLTSMAGRYPLADFSEIPKGLGPGSSVAIADTHDSGTLGERASAAFRALGIRAFIAALLVRDAKVVWTLSVAANSPREWTPDEVALVEEVLERTWDAIERASAEAALRESEERLRLAAEATGLVMFDWDLTTDRATVNARYREMLGLSEDEEVRGQAVLGQIVHPADRASVMTQLAGAFDPRSDGRFRLEHRAITSAGEHWFLAIGQVRFTGEGVGRRAARIIGNSLEITERKQVEAALSDSEERLRLAVAATGLMTFDWDVASDRVTVNDRFAEMFGLERTQTQGQQVLRNLVHPEDRDLVATHLADTFDPLSDGSYEFEHRVLTPSGERWILSIGQAYFEGEAEGRHAVRLIGNAFDITERARAEAALRAERARLQAIIDTIPVGLLILEPSGKPSLENEELSRIWRGRVPLEGIGDYARYKGYWPSTGEPLAVEDWPAARALLHGRKTLALEVDIERLDGSRGTVLYSAAPIQDGDGITVGAVVAAQDISERKQAEVALRESEEQFRAVANLVPDLLWSTPRGGHTDWYNQRWLEYTGQTITEALAGSWGASIHPDDRDNIRAKFHASRATGEPIRQELRIRSADGNYRWSLLRAELVRDAGREFSRWFGAASDIHDERVARDELTNRVREATSNLQMLSRRLLMVQEEERRHLARELHDEIGQALTGLQLQLAAARAAASGRSSSGDQRQTRRGLMEAEQIVQELTVRVSELSMDLRPSALDSFGLLPALLMHVDRYEARTRLRIDLRHQGLDRRFAPDVEIAAYRVVQEALTNVVRHAGATTATVQLLADDQVLSLAIRDDGHGFDPSAQPDSGGLSGMRERVELLGGTLAIEAAADGGTLVTAGLPLHRMVADAPTDSHAQ